MDSPLGFVLVMLFFGGLVFVPLGFFVWALIQIERMDRES